MSLEALSATQTNYANAIAIGLVLTTVIAVPLKWLLEYTNIDNLESLISDLHDLLTDQREKLCLPSKSSFEASLFGLKHRLSDFKYVCYSIDNASWISIISFILWRRWKEPVAINWQAGRLRREILAEAEVEKAALERYLASRQHSPVQRPYRIHTD
ncbi:hypothetical protein VNI00_009397 [Paramarasmius palmivorus]|uniref:ATP synthase protein MI25 n=1 Tax=Paramarasmius palmivorus TaxID=297713 RepID=A0AAW0CSL5_9AGAR